MLHREVRSVLMDSLALAVFLKQPTQHPSETPAAAPIRQKTSGNHQRGSLLANAWNTLRHALSRDTRRPCH